MREIKFRAWDGEKYIYWDRVKLLRYIQFEAIGIIEQFTGLKDKNGVDIYEGHICEAEYYNHERLNHKRNQIVVKYKGAFWLKDKDYDIKTEEFYSSRCMTLLCEFFNPTPNKIKVIGNIHQNN